MLPQQQTGAMLLVCDDVERMIVICCLSARMTTSSSLDLLSRLKSESTLIGRSRNSG